MPDQRNDTQYREALKLALRGAPLLWKTLIALHYYEERSYSEIAKQLDVREYTVRANHENLLSFLRTRTDHVSSMRRGQIAILEAAKLFGYLLPRQLRLRVFQPSFEDLKSDYLETRRMRSRTVQRWLLACFCFKALLILIGALRALVTDSLMWMLPKRLREWWISL